VQTTEEKLRDAVRDKDFVTMTKLLNAKAQIDDSDAYGNTPLMIAADHGLEDILDELLFRGAKVNLKDSAGQTALSFACFSGHFKLVKVLLEHKASTNYPSSDLQTPLMKACYARNVHSPQVLVCWCICVR
jgi:ankyrin repeat protein